MAKKTTKKRPQEAPEEEDSIAVKSRSARKMLMAAAVMCAVSLGAGFFLARMAFLDDATKYEPEYVSDEVAEGADEHAGEDAQVQQSNAVHDPLAHDGHPAGEAVALQDNAGHDGKTEGGHGDEGGLGDGILEFGDILTNISSVNASGQRVKAFLKINLIVVYRTDPGAADIMRERQPFMRDLFNAYMRGLTEADVRGMAGILHLKAQLLKRARAAAGSDLPQEILINDLIVQ